MGKQWPQKTIIGLTGNIATGKSAVMHLAAEAGALTLDADAVVHSLMDYDSRLQGAIGVAFGAQMRLPDGRVDRAALGELVFKDAGAMKDLEQMVHPLVRQEIIARIEQSDKLVVIIEAIKLLEGDLKKLCDQVWATRCPAQRQIERLVICRGMDPAAAKQRVEMQGSQEAKIAQADVVFDTHGPMENTHKQFALAWRRLLGVDPTLRRKLAEPLVAAAAPAASVTPTTPTPTAKPAATPPRPTAKPVATPAAEKAAPINRPQPIAIIPPTTPAPSHEEINVRRARPSDVPAILLHLHKATDGQVKMSRAELLMALGDRSYFIAQAGSTISIVVGWHIENLIARVDQLYIFPPEAAATALDPVLKDIEKSAMQHFCEIIMAFLPNDQVDRLGGYLAFNEYQILNPDNLPRVWKQALQESQPANTLAMIKILREDRITAPI
ncbi:MAG: dephospho-CoA kinase [Anaerolineae bacterium]|nr:dephospho-CoA kinase [Anaerolineae bacterium]